MSNKNNYIFTLLNQLPQKLSIILDTPKGKIRKTTCNIED